MHQQWWLTFSLWDVMTRTYKGNSLPALQMSSHYRTSLSWCKQWRVVREPEINSQSNHQSLFNDLHTDNHDNRMPHRPSHLQLVVKVAAALSMAQALTNLARNTAQHGLFHVNSVTLWDTLPKYVVKRGKTTRHRPVAMLLPPLVRMVRRHCKVIWQRLFIHRALRSQTPHPHG